MLDVVQVFAWARMFTQYAEAMPVSEAALETLDPNKPCSICLAVRRARDETKHQPRPAWASAAEKLLLAFHDPEPAIFAPTPETWLPLKVGTPVSWRSPVPVPPPRTTALVAIV